MFFTRNRGSKHLRARTGGGRFKRATIADLGMATCSSCGRFFESRTIAEPSAEDPFPFPVKTTHCPHCGKVVTEGAVP